MALLTAAVSLTLACANIACEDFKYIEADAETKARVVAARAYIEELRQGLGSGHATFRYFTDVSVNREPLKRVELTGETWWRGDQVKYYVRSTGDDTRVALAVVRDPKRKVVVQWTVNNEYVAIIKPPAADPLFLIEEDRDAYSLADPAVFLGRHCDLLWAIRENKRVRSEGTDESPRLVAEPAVENKRKASRIDFTYSKRVGMLPVATAHYDSHDGKEIKLVQVDLKWRAAGKLIVPDELLVARYTRLKGSKSGNQDTGIAFVEFEPNAKVSDFDLSAESLPIAENIAVIDQRTTPATYSNIKTELRKSAKTPARAMPPTPKKQNVIAISDEAAAAESAAAVRRAYYMRVGAVVLIVVAAAAAIGAVILRARK